MATIVIKQAIVVAGVVLGGLAQAKDAKEPIDLKEVKPDPRWDLCEVLETMGDWVYRDKKNPYIQGLRFNGRIHLQYADLEGEGIDGEDFSEDFDEFRRLRLGMELRFLEYFELKAGGDFVSDREAFDEDRGFGYENFDRLLIEVNLEKMFDLKYLDDLTLEYGRQKIALGAEAHQSSRRIKTVERSALVNKVYPARATGVTLHASKDDWSGAAGVFSTGLSNDISSWNHGFAYYLTSTVELKNGDDVIFDVLYNDANGTSDNELEDRHGYLLFEWAASASYIYKKKDLRIAFNAIYGDNGVQERADREGNFYGVVVMPSYWLIEDRLEAVVRYTYQKAEESNGIRLNGRYARRENGGEVNNGRGDRHESIYGGLNLHFCEGKSKFMAGIEYETLDTDDGNGEVDLTTLWLAYRMYF